MTRELELNRTFAASRERVFDAWTRGEALEQWWGPAGHDVTVTKLDLRRFGELHYLLRDPDGRLLRWKAVYRMVERPERLVFMSALVDEDEKLTRNPVDAAWPRFFQTEVTFDDLGQETSLVFRMWPMNASGEEHATFQAAIPELRQELDETFEQLAAHLTDS